MPQVSEQNSALDFPRGRTENDFFSETKEIIYPEQREDDMGETSFHAKLINRFLGLLLNFFESKKDIFLSSNMNVYYVEGNPYKWFAPDILAAFGVPNNERSVYKLWQEKVFPQVIFEVASDRTWKNDVDEKLKLYERLGAEEYYILDSEFKYLPAPLMAFRRTDGKLSPAPISDDRIFSPRLGLEIVRTENSFRLYDPNTKEFLQTLEESKIEIERLKAEIERLMAQK